MGNVGEGALPGGDKSGRVMKLITHLHLVPRIIMRGAKSPLPHSSQESQDKSNSIVTTLWAG